MLNDKKERERKKKNKHYKKTYYYLLIKVKYLEIKTMEVSFSSFMKYYSNWNKMFKT